MVVILSCFLLSCSKTEPSPKIVYVTVREPPGKQETAVEDTALRRANEERQWKLEAKRKELEAEWKYADEQRQIYADVIKIEERRLSDMKIELGLLETPLRHAVFDMARRIAVGRGLTREELTFAKTTQIFALPLQIIAEALADNKPIPALGEKGAEAAMDFAAFLRMTGQNEPLRKAREKERHYAKQAKGVRDQLDALR